jgi:hypothetical protein
VKYLLVLFVLGCCGGDDTEALHEPHDAVACDSAWTANGFTDCEAGCADSAAALGATGPSCDGTLATGSAFACFKTFVYNGVTGCCASDKPHLYWADCP